MPSTITLLRQRLQGNPTRETIEKVRRAAVLLGKTIELPTPSNMPNNQDFSVENIPLDDIHLDKARFQPRDDFSEEKVQEIVTNFNPALFKPLIVWKDPKDSKTYVLAGHHRYEALKRMKRKSAPVVFAQGDEQKAVELAWTENQSGRSQTEAENAKYLRKLAMSGRTKSEIKSECQRLYGRSCVVALDLSHLNPRGKALVDLGLLNRESETFRDQETMCQWIGKIRGRFEELTNSHENEIYDFLRENYKIRGKKFTNSAEFGAFMENIITKRTSFGVIDERLNINTFTPQTSVAAEYDAEIARAERDFAEARKTLENKQTEAAKNTDVSQEQIDKVLKKYTDAVILAEREVLRLREAKYGGVREAKASEMALFGLGGEKTSQQHYFSVKAEFWATVGIAAKPIWADCEALFRKRKRKDEEQEFSSPQELCEAIEYTLNNVEGVFTASKEDGIGLYAKQDGVFAVVMEIREVRGRYRVATIWKAAYQKFAQKIKRNNRVIANAPSSSDLLTQGEVLSGRLGVLSNTHSAGSESKDSDFSAQNQNLAGCVITTTRERILNDWNGLFEEEKLAMQHSRSLSPAKQKQQEKLRRAAILLRFQDECIGTELIRQREHIKKIYNRFTEEYQLYINLQSTEAKKRYTETRRMVRFLEEKLNEEETKWALPLTPSLLNEQDNLSDTTSTRDLLLQKWNTSTLTSEEREKVRRGAVLLGIRLNENAESKLTTISNATLDAFTQLLGNAPKAQRLYEAIKNVRGDEWWNHVVKTRAVKNEVESLVGNKPNLVESILKIARISPQLGSEYAKESEAFEKVLRTSNPLSDRIDTRALLLQKWNDSTLTSEQREKVRRASVLLNLALPATTTATTTNTTNYFANYDNFFRSTEDFFRQQIITDRETQAANFQAQIEALQEVPASWDGTKKDYLESVQERVSTLRGQRENAKLSITRYRNNDLTDQDKNNLAARVRPAFEQQGGVLTEEQRSYRLDKLMQIVFTEDSKDEQFYPTPKDIIQEMMLPLASIQAGMRVLEPSAGKGDIADLIREQTGVTADVVELNPIRAEVLRLKGYNVQHEGDFLNFTPASEEEKYDVIMMNPPFLKGLDIIHVRHAYDNVLKAGGKIVALLGARAIKDLKSIDAASFFNFLEKRDAVIQMIPRDRYNRQMERKIMIDIALVAVEKPLTEAVVNRQNIELKHC